MTSEFVFLILYSASSCRRVSEAVSDMIERARGFDQICSSILNSDHTLEFEDWEVWNVWHQEPAAELSRVVPATPMTLSLPLSSKDPTSHSILDGSNLSRRSAIKKATCPAATSATSHRFGHRQPESRPLTSDTLPVWHYICSLVQIEVCVVVQIEACVVVQVQVCVLVRVQKHRCSVA